MTFTFMAEVTVLSSFGAQENHRSSRKQDWKDGWGIASVWGTMKNGACFEHLKLKVDLGLEEGGEFIGAKGGGPATWRSCD